MKNYISIAATIVILSGCGNSLSTRDDAPADINQQKREAIEEYFSIAPMDELWQGMVEEISYRFPEDQRQAFVDFMTKHVRIHIIEEAAKESLYRHLSLEEIKVYTEFMKRPEARSAMRKMKYYMADLMPIIQQEMQRAVKEAEAEQKKSPDLPE